MTGTKKGTSVIAACGEMLNLFACRDPNSCMRACMCLFFTCAPVHAGIFVNEIADAVPIDKYFEMFKPNAGGEGGFIRICLDLVKDGDAPKGACPYARSACAGRLGMHHNCAHQLSPPCPCVAIISVDSL